MELKEYMLKIIFFNDAGKIPANYFQDGCIVTIESILGLFSHLKCVHGLSYLMCSHCDQDYGESIIGALREGGGVRKPSALLLQYRIKRNAFTIFCLHIFLYIFWWCSLPPSICAWFLKFCSLKFRVWWTWFFSQIELDFCRLRNQ